MSTPSTPRIFAILPRDGQQAVIFRRGPSRLVQLISWDLHSDSFQPGQWLKGRIYERRCDLSPSGKLLIYFAANQKPPYYTWTAISKPPFLTALALWSCCGTWLGGGLFTSETSAVVRGDFLEKGSVPDHFFITSLITVTKLADTPGPLSVSWHERDGTLSPPIVLTGLTQHTSDQPIYAMRLQRDGWRLTQPGRFPPSSRRTSGDNKLRHPFETPEIYCKSNLLADGRIFDLQMKTLGFGDEAGPRNLTEYQVIDHDHNLVVDLGKIDWADWDRNGDLLYTESGQMFRLSPDPQTPSVFDIQNARSLYDFRNAKFTEVPPTPEALYWD